MKNFFRDHPNTPLITLAIFFLTVIVGFYFWGMNDIIVAINKAMNYAPPQQSAGFDLQGAAKLDLRGLVK